MKEYGFYRSLVQLVGEPTADEIVREHFVTVRSSKSLSKQILRFGESDIRDYVAKDLYGPLVKPFTHDDDGAESVVINFTLLLPREHEKIIK